MTLFCTSSQKAAEVKWSRRRLLTLGGLAAATCLAPRSVVAHLGPYAIPEKSLNLYNTHTGEGLKTVYWSQGHYVPEALAEVNRILRDHRADEIHSIDAALLDLLCSVHRRLEARQPFSIISGYRSPATNAMLRQLSSGVAKNSLHIQGKAIDIRLPGRDIAALHRVAVDLRRGGVGYYPQSNFVHLDTGTIRYW